ncbi:MKI67 FHA domain-interacting nucleolar phosphoprotein-like [Patiria miniata]|uniref:RRM domain-containing protein n=1 Tax=Patiria miniata TaxID=46514 RepID=A0A914A330_PATMI|nr:MKI67 FHA domain-interacting nucleolar phosphoprotein-like [Patiria miniata]
MAFLSKDVNSEFLEKQQKKRKRGKKKSVGKMADEVEVSGDPEDVGVVYLSHIPHGFYEPQMRHFFSQFGTVNRLKLWRSKKSGKSRGFAYIEFEYADVAKIVADTMNNYLMFQKLLKCKFIPNGEVCGGAFRNAERRFVKPYHRKLAKERHNSLLTANEARIVKSQQRLVQMEGRRKKKMAKLGIECNLPGYTEEWENIKKARAFINEQKKVEALRKKEIEQRKQEALKRAKQKVKLLSLKRKISKRHKRREEREKGESEKQQSSTDEKSQEGVDGDKKSPKRKLDSQDLAVPSSNEADRQTPAKKKGKLSTSVSPIEEAASPASPLKKNKEEKSSGALSQTRKSGRLSLKRAASPAVKSKFETPKKTGDARKSTAATPKSTAKNLSKDTSVTPKVVPETPKVPSSLRKDQGLLSKTKTPQSRRKSKTSEPEPSSDDYESSDTPEEEPKIKEFTGIRLSKSEQKDVTTKKRSKNQARISLNGDQLLIF